MAKNYRLTLAAPDSPTVHEKCLYKMGQLLQKVRADERAKLEGLKDDVAASFAAVFPTDDGGGDSGCTGD